MYAARPLIQQQTDKRLNDQYFTQTLLPDYIREHSVPWDVVFDDRGHFREPHTARSIGLGTLSVRDYLAKLNSPNFTEARFARAAIGTFGPECRFGAMFFIEKEGFGPLLRRARIASRFDVAIMSTKGMSNTAARTLVDRLCSRYGIPLLVLHDFDKAGFSIVGTLGQSNRRYSFGHSINVIDIGLRLRDIDGLESEETFDRGSPSAIRANLRANGATPDEIEFLLERRVEINAFASDDLVAFIERKLTEHGVAKVLPSRDRLAEAYELFERSARIQKIVEAALDEQEMDETVNAPDNLDAQVSAYLKEHPEARWDYAVRAIAGDVEDEEDSNEDDADEDDDS
jgi:hypothetical protein